MAEAGNFGFRPSVHAANACRHGSTSEMPTSCSIFSVEFSVSFCVAGSELLDCRVHKQVTKRRSNHSAILTRSAPATPGQGVLDRGKKAIAARHRPVATSPIRTALCFGFLVRSLHPSQALLEHFYICCRAVLKGTECPAERIGLSSIKPASSAPPAVSASRSRMPDSLARLA